MNPPKIIGFEIPEGCTPDLEFRFIMAKALDRVCGEASEQQVRAACNWFNKYSKAYLENHT